jgi:hypothetical protein
VERLLVVVLGWLMLPMSWLPVVVLPPQADSARTDAAAGRARVRRERFMRMGPFHQQSGEVVQGGVRVCR